MMKAIYFGVAAAVLLAGAVFAAAEYGIPARVVRVIDGDTVTVQVGFITRDIRIAGIDTPELNGRCDLERDMAREARSVLKRFIGEHVTLHNPRLGKYRWVAWIGTADGRDVSLEMVRYGYARPYDGGKRGGWC